MTSLLNNKLYELDSLNRLNPLLTIINYFYYFKCPFIKWFKIKIKKVIKKKVSIHNDERMCTTNLFLLIYSVYKVGKYLPVLCTII